MATPTDNEKSSSNTRWTFTPNDTTGTTVEFLEKAITPPALQMEDGCDHTYMGDSITSKEPGYAMTIGPASGTVAFSPSQEDTIRGYAVAKTLGTLEITFDSGRKQSIANCFIKEFTPSDWSRGATDAPTAQIVIDNKGGSASVPSNTTPSSND